MKIAGLSFLSCWFAAFHQRHLQGSLTEENRHLCEKIEGLEQLNKALDHKIHERTRNLVNLQTQLLQAEKFAAIGQLAAGIAHEINNPVGFINSNLQTLQQYVAHYTRLLGILNRLEKALKDKDQQRVAEVVDSWGKIRRETNFAFIGTDIGNLLKESMEGTAKIGKIVADLRTLASRDRGRIASVNLEMLLESTLNIAHNEIKYKAQVAKEYGSLPMIVCNPQKIGQVFIHLLVNAAQAIEGKGTITVKTYFDGEYACVEISDTGCGIAPEHATRIFDPLFTTKPPGTGTGLGLSLSFDIVRKHGGTITFNSRLGQGTTFTVKLPPALPEVVPSDQWRDYERD
ncbi:MAG: histidine kinase [Candidatus Omnitrophica bacterium]|nr:histidine kinase [Candidatus Omnitrophota bacterium]MDE2223099.1 histidine kinase [Candidatus Omnitrophota bacterium]